MSIILFIIILAALVFVHELGHFVVAKLFKIRVDEFGLGFPPRLWGKKYGETTYTLNVIPFGGFVKIFGENPDDASINGPDAARSFVHKNKLAQIAVLVAGVAFNFIFAWILISIGFMSGMPVSVSQFNTYPLENQRVMITAVSPDSPAFQAGIKVGDAITDVSVGALRPVELTTDSVRTFIAAHGGESVAIVINRGTVEETKKVTPITGVVANKAAIGVGLDTVGSADLPFVAAFKEGAILTWRLTVAVAEGLVTFLQHLFTGAGTFSEVTGPIGIAGMVGDAQTLGLVYLLSFTALISINLGVINLIPFPALDGGRVLFVLIEAVTRRRIKPAITNTVNTVGFALLLLLMVAVTYKDIVNLF